MLLEKVAGKVPVNRRLTVLHIISAILSKSVARMASRDQYGMAI